jgi:hypothetical protein
VLVNVPPGLGIGRHGVPPDAFVSMRIDCNLLSGNECLGILPVVKNLTVLNSERIGEVEY